MIRARPALFGLAAVLLHALAREVDRGLGLVLRSEVEPDGLLAEVGRAMGAEASGAAVRVALWLVAGARGVARAGRVAASPRGDRLGPGARGRRRRSSRCSCCARR